MKFIIVMIRAIENDYATLEKLHKNFNIPFKLNELSLPSTYFLPPIGVEIEIGWKHAVPNYSSWFQEPFKQWSVEKKKDFDVLMDVVDRRYKPNIALAIASGIPSGKKEGSVCDGYCEFAFSPVSHYDIVSKQIDFLFSQNILPQNKDLSMQITLGDMRVNSNTGILSFILEMLGGSTPQRVLSPNSNSRFWAKKESQHTGGILERYAYELKGGSESAVELRTLVANSSSQVHGVLRTAQLLAASIEHNELDSNSEPSLIWESIKSEVIESIFIPHNLHRKWWLDPVKNKSQWTVLANLMEDEYVVGNLWNLVNSKLTTLESLLFEK